MENNQQDRKCYHRKILKTLILIKIITKTLALCISGSPWKVGIMPSPKMSVVGDSVRLVPANSPAIFELSALGFSSNEIQVQILSKYNTIFF